MARPVHKLYFLQFDWLPNVLRLFDSSILGLFVFLAALVDWSLVLIGQFLTLSGHSPIALQVEAGLISGDYVALSDFSKRL